MRKSTIASLLILCGSTAALANVAQPGPQTTNTTNSMNMSNDMMMDPAPMNDAMDSPMPDNMTMRNEANPKPM